MNVETFLDTLNDTYKPAERSRYSTTMVMAPTLVCKSITDKTIDAFNNLCTRDEANAEILKNFQEAHKNGDIFCYSLSRTRYSRPVAIVKVDDDSVEIETRPNETRKFRLCDVYDTSKLPLSENA